VYSPGGIGSKNTDEAFNEFRQGSTANYVYGRAELRHEIYLPLGFSWYTRASGQYSDARLVATEIWSIGGWDTVRGYDERIVSGDHGWLLNNELRAPLWRLGNMLKKEGASDWIQFLAFCDWGGAITKDPDPTTERSQEVLLSVGGGLRFAMADNFHVRFDYGFALDREYLTAPNASSLGSQPKSRAHFGLEVSY
jgi:hemolysin activation/secretion protein